MDSSAYLVPLAATWQSSLPFFFLGSSEAVSAVHFTARSWQKVINSLQYCYSFKALIYTQF